MPCKIINGLLERNTFEFVSMSSVFSEMRIFISYFVNKIKNERITTAIEKLRIVVQVYNNHDKEKILIQSSTI